MTSGAPREERRLRGNRIWIVPTPDGGGGEVLQKLYAPHDSGPGYWARLVLERIARAKTPTSVAARHRTERELLAAWREAGCDVPADLTDRYPALVHPRVTLLEYVRGPLLGRRLSSGKSSGKVTSKSPFSPRARPLMAASMSGMASPCPRMKS